MSWEWEEVQVLPSCLHLHGASCTAVTLCTSTLWGPWRPRGTTHTWIFKVIHQSKLLSDVSWKTPTLCSAEGSVPH